MAQIPRVEALHASTLGYEIATPTELPRQRGPSPTSLKPLPNPPQREGVPPNRLKHSKNGLPPLGGGPGRGFSKAAVFVPASAGLFLPPTAAFFTVVTAGVMQRMTVEMMVTTRRKTCFPTVGTTVTTKAKPPAVSMAFCVYFSPSPTLPKGRAFHPTA